MLRVWLNVFLGWEFVDGVIVVRGVKFIVDWLRMIISG